jgi:hypothetical protein
MVFGECGYSEGSEDVNLNKKNKLLKKATSIKK